MKLKFEVPLDDSKAAYAYVKEVEHTLDKIFGITEDVKQKEENEEPVKAPKRGRKKAAKIEESDATEGDDSLFGSGSGGDSAFDDEPQAGDETESEEEDLFGDFKSDAPKGAKQEKKLSLKVDIIPAFQALLKAGDKKKGKGEGLKIAKKILEKVAGVTSVQELKEENFKACLELIEKTSEKLAA